MVKIYYPCIVLQKFSELFSIAENKNKDVYEQEVLKQASKSAVLVQMVLAVALLVMAIVYTIFVSLMSGCHIYTMLVSSMIEELFYF